MTSTDSLWTRPAGEALVVPQNGGGGALFRARQILRGEPDLTFEQFEELDRLFRSLNQAQFAQLTDDPLHQAALRRYEVLSWRQGRPAAYVVTGLLAFGAVAGALVTLL